MAKESENGCCITAVMAPESGVSVSVCGCRSDIKATFGVLCYEFLKSGLLSYDDMRDALTSAVIMETVGH